MTTISRETVKKHLDKLPEQVSIDQLIEKFFLIFELETAMEQSKKNQVTSHEEMKEKYAKWLR